MFCAWLIRRWNFAYLHHIHTRESPSEYSERRYWSTLMYVVLKFLSCLQFQYQTAGIRKLLVRWCGLIFLHSYLGGVLKFFDIWLGLAASSNVKEFQYSSSVTVQEYPILSACYANPSAPFKKILLVEFLPLMSKHFPGFSWNHYQPFYWDNEHNLANIEY